MALLSNNVLIVVYNACDASVFGTLCLYVALPLFI